MVRSNSGYWKITFRINLSTLNIGLMMHGRARWQEAEAIRKNSILYWLVRTNSLLPSSSKSFRTQSHWFCTSGQCVDSEQISSSTLLSCWAVSLHSITNSGLIAEGQNSSRERQTVFFTAVNPMNKNHKEPQELDLTKNHKEPQELDLTKNHKEPQELDLTKPRLAWYKQMWKRHQDTV